MKLFSVQCLNYILFSGVSQRCLFCILVQLSFLEEKTTMTFAKQLKWFNEEKKESHRHSKLSFVEFLFIIYLILFCHPANDLKPKCF